MAETNRKRVLLPTDVLYLVTFTLGMLGFWVSGHISALLPRIAGGDVFQVVTRLMMTSAIYALIMLVVAAIVLRRFLPTVIATIVALILGSVAAQLIVSLAASHISGRSQFALLTFILYFVYGLIYVVALVIGRKLAKRRTQATIDSVTGNGQL